MINHYVTYAQIANNNYDMYVKYKDEIRNDKKDENFAKMFDCIIISIVFEALAIEAYMNVYGVYHLGYDTYKHIEKIGIEDKCLALGKLINKYDFMNNEVYKELKYLFQIRNRLVHNKAVVTPEFLSETDVDNWVVKVFGDGKYSYDQILEKVHGICGRWIIELRNNHNQNIKNLNL